MSSNTLKATTLDPQTLEQLQIEIKQELLKVLNQSQLKNLLKKYGISDSQVLQLSYRLDVNKLQSIDAHQEQLVKESFLTSYQEPIDVNLVLLQPCPIEGYPDGCWVDS